MEMYKTPEGILPENRINIQDKLDRIVQATTSEDIDVEAILDLAAQIGDDIKNERDLVDMTISKLEQAGGRVDKLNETLGSLMTRYSTDDDNNEHDDDNKELTQDEADDLLDMI